MRRGSSGFVLGYHGCDSAVADKLVAGDSFLESKNDYDWLGFGIYFWEGDPERALHWAKEIKKRGASIDKPAVVGAVIDPGWCLDLTTQASLDVTRKAFVELKSLAKQSGAALVKNKDFFRRNRDCAVFNYLFRSMPTPKFQTIRSVLTEGDPLYEGTEIQSKTHVQIVVRDHTCIKGVFHVRDLA